MRIFTSLPRRPSSPSASCSINVPVVLILEKIYICKRRLSHILSEWRCHSSPESFQVMSYWFGDGSMHRRRSTTEGEESHMAKIIHFHRLVKAQGSQHLWPPQKQLWEKKKRIPPIFSGWCILPWMVFEPLWIINSQRQGDDVIASWERKLWVSRHMSSIFFWTSGLLCCHSCQHNSKHT